MIRQDGENSVDKKALQINLDATKYGTFAEIGAGQEVARQFFHVGGASGTIAKTISAYDMTFSDAIYGPTPRYVSRQRLNQMLEYEYRLLIERLADKRGGKTSFFAFANTVAARAYNHPSESHGWLGIRWQAHPRAEPNQIIIHVRMLDKENLQQQEALGSSASTSSTARSTSTRVPEKLIGALLDSLDTERIQVDMIKFTGPDFHYIDNRLMALQLVEQGLSDAAMFTADGEVVRADELLYKKTVLVERGSFRPLTNTTQDILDCAKARFLQEPKVMGEETVVLMEITMQNLAAWGGPGGKIDHTDFIDRVEVLGKLGHTVLVSKFGEYFRLGAYLSRCTNKMIGIAMGIPSLIDLFQEKYYTNLEGGILESLGRSVQRRPETLRLPGQGREDGRGADRADPEGGTQPAKPLRPPRGEPFHRATGGLQAREPVDLLARGAEAHPERRPAWETMVPPAVAEMIKKGRLYGYQAVHRRLPPTALRKIFWQARCATLVPNQIWDPIRVPTLFDAACAAGDPRLAALLLAFSSGRLRQAHARQGPRRRRDGPVPRTLQRRGLRQDLRHGRRGVPGVQHAGGFFEAARGGPPQARGLQKLRQPWLEHQQL